MATENYQEARNQQAAKAFSRNAGETVSHLKDAAQTLNSDLQHLGQTTKKVAQEAMSQVKENMGHYYQTGLEKTRALEKTMETQIKGHPLSSLMIAAGVGLILGAVWSWRAKS